MLPRLLPGAAVVGAVLAAALPAAGQAPLVAPAPLTAGGRATNATGTVLEQLQDAQRAQDVGLPSIAVEEYRRLLALPAGSGVDRTQVILLLTGALLDAGQVSEVQPVLDLEPPASRGGQWHLRAGLVAAYARNWAQANGEFNLIPNRGADLRDSERAWWYFGNGLLAEADRDWARSNSFYLQAEREATSDYARARFRIAGMDAALRRGSITDDEIARARTEQDLDARLRLAMMLAARGRTIEAVSELQAQIRALSAQASDLNRLAQFQLVLGLVGDRSVGGVGRNVLYQVIRAATPPEGPLFQRAALQVVARASVSGEARDDFARRLDEMIAGPTPAAESIRPDLLLLRAQLETQDGRFQQADADANEILRRYPDSGLKAHALGVLVETSWQRARFRDAAAHASDARREIAGGPAHAALGLVIAEAYFRTGDDYRLAADAYAAVAAEPPAGMSVADVLFQRLLAEIRAAQLDPRVLRERVVPLVDETEANPAFDQASRWQTEWNLEQAFLRAGDPATAYSRLTRLLDTDPASPALPLALRARMEWLLARLAKDTGRPQDAIQRAEKIGTMAGVEPEILAMAEMVRGEALLALNREADAAAAFENLRKKYPGSGAAEASYLAQAADYEDRENIVEAERLLNQLASEFPRSAYAPAAIFNAAALEEKLGRPDDAYRRLEDIPTRYADSKFVIAAREKQGELRQKAGDYAEAELHYNQIIDRLPPSNEHYQIAKLNRADLYRVAAASDPGSRNKALVDYNSLATAAGASPDIRIQAGYKWGNLLFDAHDYPEAQRVWWDFVVRPFLVERRPDSPEPTDGGRYFLAKTLFDLASLYAAQKKPDESRRTLQMVIDANLTEDATREARARLGLEAPAGP